MRLFTGISLAAKIVDELSAVSMRLRSHDDGLRWSAPESWHITLQFLGNAREEQYPCIVERLRQLRLWPVPIRIEKMGFFERAGIFFAGVAVTPQLLLFQQRVVAATGPCGFAAEDRPYRPHITLARSKGKGSRQTFRRLEAKIGRQPHFTGFTAREFLLYESVPGPAGSRYEVRERFPLDDRQAY